jgi:uncharacterized protein (TIGR02453 family)
MAVRKKRKTEAADGDRKADRSLFPDDFRPDFAGFGPAAFTFFRRLKRNNERAWFQANKEAYDTEVKFPLECLIAEFASDRAAARGLAVKGDPGRGLFRIHRDVRFSHNKLPYKTHAGAVLSRTGGRGEPGVVYIHVEPGNCRVSAGFWRTEPHELTAWRNRIVDDPEAWLDIVGPYADPKGKMFMRTISSLARLPRGFQEHKGSAIEPYLLWKSFLLTRPVSDAEAAGRGLIDIVRTVARAAAPLLEFGWEVFDAPLDKDPRRHAAAAAVREAGRREFD